jgi:hypothetical protein
MVHLSWALTWSSVSSAALVAQSCENAKCSRLHPWRTANRLRYRGARTSPGAAAKSVKTNLWSTFKSSSLGADRQAESLAKQNLAQQILAKNSSLTEYERALSQAQLKVIQDEDAIAQNGCGQLSTSQLAAASTLYTNLQNNWQTTRGYFEAAREASGQTTGQAAEK